MLPPPLTGPYSPAYYYRRNQINNKYNVLTGRVIRTGHQMHPYDAYDIWLSNSVRAGVYDSLGRLNQEREQELTELLAAELEGRLTLNSGLSSFTDYGTLQGAPMPLYSSAPSLRTGMMYGSRAASMVPGTFSEPFMEGQRPVGGQYSFTGQRASSAGPSFNGMAAYQADYEQDAMEYLQSASASATNDFPEPRHGSPESISPSVLSGTTLVGHDASQSTTASGTATIQGAPSRVSTRPSTKGPLSMVSRPTVNQEARSGANSSATSSLTGTWVGGAHGSEFSAAHQTDEATAPAIQESIYAPAYPLSTSSSGVASSGRPTSVLASDLSPDDSISQNGTTTSSKASGISTAAPSSGFRVLTNASRQSFSNYSRPSQTRGSALSPIAEATSSSSGSKLSTSSSRQSQRTASTRGKQTASTSSGQRSTESKGTGYDKPASSSASRPADHNPIRASPSGSQSRPSSGVPSSGSSNPRNPASSSSGQLSTSYVAYAGTTMETDELKSTDFYRWHAIARSNVFESLLLIASAAANGNSDLLSRLKRHEGRFHFYNALYAEPDLDGREFTAEERRVGRNRHFDAVRTVAVTRRGGSDELPKEIAQKVQRFASLNKRGQNSV